MKETSTGKRCISSLLSPIWISYSFNRQLTASGSTASKNVSTVNTRTQPSQSTTHQPSTPSSTTKISVNTLLIHGSKMSLPMACSFICTRFVPWIFTGVAWVVSEPYHLRNQGGVGWSLIIIILFVSLFLLFSVNCCFIFCFPNYKT